ncbi:beta-ketoacyl synthase N-terminal-like domain-containing protein [Saccharopolyspora sp. WRP15-2]|uniref:Beta-ketoacyl synthase N-terminal-like domain-containing protein n=1 Tax=Saccharopolyspora oryzae TaxID=2997343 RepID=A0ABT4UZT3_9PSEU|nr:polyketide synthase [Saccharopolyspora oryzae]MDA3627078.1 beta-ketoacyl synthase N-terminal-like domain-containing protein [Saccharopolyspora oryzae]
MTKNAQLAPLAIVGMSCRVPGGDDVDEFWETLLAGRPAMGPVPAERLVGYDAEVAGEGGLTAALVSDVDTFDAGFFDVVGRMAVWMDPQQRLLLETTWRALESAGIAPSSLRGQEVGVFVGSSTSDFRDGMISTGVLDRYSLTGSIAAYLSNRVSNFFDLRGPSITVDTACSSGLSALALAASGLRAGDFDTAIVGGSNVYASGWLTGALAHMGALSPTGTCRPFSDDANGYVRGEGVLCFVVKRLDDALEAGDPVLAIIRGAAANHDGRAGGLVKTDSGSQARLLRRTLAQGDVDPASLGYLEAHAPGTKLDVEELNGLRELVREHAAGPVRFAGPGERLWIGTVKAVIGHLEGAAGTASLAKAVLVLGNGAIPTGAGILGMDGDLEIHDQPAEVAQGSVPWEPGDAPRRLGVSSFGIGGSNAHVVLEEPPAADSPDGSWGGTSMVFPISGTDDDALRRVAARLAEFVAGPTAPEPTATAWTLQTGRDHLTARAVVRASTNEELRAGLVLIAEGVDAPEETDPRVREWLGGGEIDWSKLWHHPPRRRVRLPGYPFLRTPYGIAPKTRKVAR